VRRHPATATTTAIATTAHHFSRLMRKGTKDS
jgi:hypothetical protein